jgi:hypothetical protein
MYENFISSNKQVSTIIDQHSQVQEKLTQFNTSEERIGYIDQWIKENPDAPVRALSPL